MESLTSAAPPPDIPAGPPAGPDGFLLYGGWIAAALGAICFINSLGNGFVYDDEALLLNDPRIRSLDPSSVGRMLVTDWWNPLATDAPSRAENRDRLYRPLAMLSLALNHAVHGLSAFGYHAVNVLLHALACLLVWAFVLRLLDDRAVALCTALLFAVHPVHAEAVANVVGRADVLATIFILAGLIVLLPRSGALGWPRALAAGGLFLLALLSKETAVCYWPIALLAIHLWSRGKSPAAGWPAIAIVLATPLLIYLPLRFIALEGHWMRTGPPVEWLNPLGQADGLERVLAPFTIAGHYVRLLLLPLRLSADYGLAVVVPAAGANSYTALGALAGLGLLALLAGYRSPARPRQVLAAVSAMTLASYALISNVLVLIGVTLAERLAYWPSVPVLLLIALVLVDAYRRASQSRGLADLATQVARIGGVLVLLALAGRSFARSAEWQSGLRLFEKDAQTFPQSLTNNFQFALQSLLAARGETIRENWQARLETALLHLERALEICPTHANSWYLRGVAYEGLGNVAAAIASFQKAVGIDPEYADARQRLAELQRAAAAARVKSLTDALAANADDNASRVELARALLAAEKPVDALPIAQEAVRREAESLEALAVLADVQNANNQSEQAQTTLETIVRIAPQNGPALAKLATTLARGEPARALELGLKAESLGVRDMGLRLVVTELLAASGQLPAAVARYQQILTELPAEHALRGIVTNRVSQLQAAAATQPTSAP